MRDVPLSRQHKLSFSGILYGNSRLMQTGIVDPRPLCLRDERSTPPVTPAPPSTPRKVQPTAMTVSVTHAQVTVTTTAPSTAMMALAMGRPPSPGNSSGSDTDGITNASARTALRRLYFKSGRNAKPKPAASNASNVPKVIVMGSSTASTSETTINTSTESASTLVTNVTATDTSETCDSLDMGDTSGQSEPLLSSLDEPPQTAVSLTSEQSGSEIEGTISGGQEKSSLSEIKTNDSSPLGHNMPRTAPVTTSVHFPFDMPPSPKSVKTTEKNQSLFTFTETADFLEQQRQRSKSLHQPFFHDGNVETSLSFYEGNDKENIKRKDAHSKFCSGKDHSKSPKDGSHANITSEYDDSKKSKKDTKFKSKNGRHLMKTSPKKDKFTSSSNKINSAPVITSKEKYYAKMSSSGYDKRDLTMFPFDREAIDYERIQKECFAVEEDPKLPYNATESDSETDSDEDPSVYERKPYCSPSKPSKIDVFQQYTLLSQQETYHSYERRPPKRTRPDLFHSKYDHLSKTDAFSPKPIDSSSPKPINEPHKFEQIASKFDQIPPKMAQGTNANAPNQSGNNVSNTGITTNLSGSGSASSAGSSGGTSGSRATPPLPDLRFEFFAETAGLQQHLQQKHQQHQQHQQHHQQHHEVLDDCQKVPQNAGAINVTANPMETAVCTQPRATIVVQQASLSLDNTVETFLLKNEGDFVSVEQAKESRKKKQQREENMRQLLDVTNTLTFEEIRDFEMRYGSPHHSRSQSVKTPGSRASGRPNQLSLPQQRSRVASMPNTGVEEEYYRLRHFSITGKGVVNRGDSLKSRRSRSNNSVASSNSSTEHLTANQIPAVGSARTSATCSLASSRESSTSNPGNGPYRVLMLGSSAVGKSSLVSQFMTSEYLHAYDTSIDDESGEKSVSVLLSGEESELIFIDHAFSEMSPENCLSSYDPHGYCVIYSSADRDSFTIAERILQSLWTTENIAQKAVILVGNKADLARCRVISSDEGKSMATAYDCKFIETSVGINHNVDELLVGLLSQIRLKLENPEKSRDLFRKRSTRKSKRRACSPLGGAATACLSGSGGTNPSTPIGPCHNTLITDFNTPPGSAHSSPRKYRGSRTSASLKVKGLLGRVWARDSKSKSCENLHVL